MDSSPSVAGILVLAGFLPVEFGLSSAITELLSGVLLTLFVDVSSMTWLQLLAHFGMLGLMFMAGLEVDVTAVATGENSAAEVPPVAVLKELGIKRSSRGRVVVV